MDDLLGKAIRGLESCSTYDDYSRKSCKECPYNEPDGKRSCKLHQMRVDALSLLKARIAQGRLPAQFSARTELDCELYVRHNGCYKKGGEFEK